MALIGLAGGGLLMADGCSGGDIAAPVVSGLLVSFINGWLAQSINSLLGVPGSTVGF
jgi:hypothetical protein